jgi:DNA adenine methylase
MALSYIGGKSKIGKWIVPFIPTDIETYIEPFSGMFWVFFNMDLTKYPNLKEVVYNDFNPLNYNLFQCLQNPDRLLEEVNNIPCQQRGEFPTPDIYREQFISFQAEIFDENLNLQAYDYVIAAKYAYVLAQVFSGSKPETSNFIDLKGKYKSKYLTFRDKLSKKDWVEHFLKITKVENMDFQEVIQKYDGPATYVYADPPYWKTENYYNNHDFDSADHERLADCLKSIQGKFSLSYYDFPQLHNWFPQGQFVWEKKEFAKAAAAKKGKTQNMGEELLIMNYSK